MNTSEFGLKHWIITWVICVLAGGYIIIFHSHYYDWRGLRNFGYTIYILGIFALCFILINEKFPRLLNRKGINNLLLGLLPVIVISFFLVMILFLQDAYYQKQLNNYGIVAGGKIVNITYERGRSDAQAITAVVSYKFMTQTYYKLLDNNQWRFNMNDSISIVYSSHDPEIMEVIRAY